ncbi:MAG: hypothetical protein RBT49_04080 [Bacteroidales bacterium]|nr:hypothetical protein [Bacteroidales bacterium]
MEDFRTRLIEEKDELDSKINKLNGFFKTETFDNLSFKEQELLLLQFHIMRSYYMVLDQRIDYYQCTNKE